MCMKAYEIPLSLYYYIERKEELQKLQKNLTKKTITLASTINQPPIHTHSSRIPDRLQIQIQLQPPKAKNPLIALRCSLFG